MTQTQKEAPSFNQLGIIPNILSVLAVRKFFVPTPIQHQCIPAAIEGKDVVGIAQTGTGKTLAFGIPMIQRLAREHGQGLVLLPTRELALQVDEVLKKLCNPLGMRTGVVIGGANMGQQVRMLRDRPHIVVATPGRLIDHILGKTYNLSNIKMIVLDEADRMLDIGFMPQIRQILSTAPVNRQTMMFSATMPSAISELAARYMKMPLRIEVAPSGTPAKNVEQEVYIVNKENKAQLLEKLLIDNPGTVLVFSRTKFGAKKITASLNSIGHRAVEIHSNRSLAQRKAAMEGFRSGRYRILVATDIAARGIDVVGISLVINYDLPDNLDDYVHRIGRTGRAGMFGKAVSFAAPDERGSVKQIERLIRRTLPILGLPVLPPRREPIKIAVSDDQRQRRGFNPHKRRPEKRFVPRRRNW
jgi:ATP-dependent RNA helicase RhlE